ncbi:hypothetical protein E3Q19_03365 [Wallemia mellicola]|nr:hypothetical protein E3Q19_03365 [Wallemia mellicola]TIC21381.1 hypothetical protein E3Q11_04426 [Wallemia mellicola]TIC73160.1 hypothetical protein E3Q00_03220 [Wallemia mellicola]
MHLANSADHLSSCIRRSFHQYPLFAKGSLIIGENTAAAPVKEAIEGCKTRTVPIVKARAFQTADDNLILKNSPQT